MKKRKPSHDLVAVKRVFGTSKTLNGTLAAYAGMREMGLTVEMARQVLLSLQPRHFHHSVTSFADHRDWQDVYLMPITTPSGHALVVYIKFKADLVTEFKLMSFKDKDGR